MIQLALRTTHYQKKYLVRCERYHFASFLDLAQEFFEVNRPMYRDYRELVDVLLHQLGFFDIEAVPPDVFESIVEEYRKQFTCIWDNVDGDAERLAYLLLAAIHRGRLIALIDERPVEDLRSPLQLNADSTISFIDREKIDTITFTTL